jgi:hypothetical protein
MAKFLKKTRSEGNMTIRTSPSPRKTREIAWEDSDSDGDEIEGTANTILDTDGVVGAKGYLYAPSPSFSGAIYAYLLVLHGPLLFVLRACMSVCLSVCQLACCSVVCCTA